MKKFLMIEVQGSSARVVDDLIEQLARAACDIANSAIDEDAEDTEENEAHIWISDAPPPVAT